MASDFSPKETLEMMLGHLGFVFEIREESRPSGITLNIITREPGRLIGRNGRVLDDLQYLLNRVLSGSEDDRGTVVVDVENYRAQQVDEFRQRILSVIERVRRTGQPVTMGPMNSFDRRLVHTTCQEQPDLETESLAGDGKFKKIIIRPKPKKASATSGA
ncbi:MAG: R3H domain-containing nucleic acid-binding protein [Verrucomicrobiia bacterium]